MRVTVAYYSDQTEPYFKKMAEAFEKANPGDTIKIEMVNWDTLQQKLQTDIAGGTNADLAIIGTRWLLDFVKDDMAEPLDGYMNPAFKGRFIGAFLAPGQIGGKTYGLPIAASARALYYNKETLTKAGFPNGPKTWDDVVGGLEEDQGRRRLRLRPAGQGDRDRRLLVLQPLDATAATWWARTARPPSPLRPASRPPTSTSR